MPRHPSATRSRAGRTRSTLTGPHGVRGLGGGVTGEVVQVGAAALKVSEVLAYEPADARGVETSHVVLESDGARLCAVGLERVLASWPRRGDVAEGVVSVLRGDRAGAVGQGHGAPKRSGEQRGGRCTDCLGKDLVRRKSSQEAYGNGSHRPHDVGALVKVPDGRLPDRFRSAQPQRVVRVAGTGRARDRGEFAAVVLGEAGGGIFCHFAVVVVGNGGPAPTDQFVIGVVGGSVDRARELLVGKTAGLSGQIAIGVVTELEGPTLEEAWVSVIELTSPAAS